MASYVVERQIPTGGPYVVLDTVEVPMYVDSNLVNGATYCYRVTTLGAYDDPTTESPLINLSQEACARPFDYTAPCAMTLEVAADCEVERDTLRWSPVSGCDSDDIVGYNIYWAPVLGDSLTLWRAIDNPEDTVAVFNEDDELRTIAGCFVVTALDSLLPGPDGNLRRNESVGLDTVCVDNCPYYFLPNVFSPNGDGPNDGFRAFPVEVRGQRERGHPQPLGRGRVPNQRPDIGWDGTYLDTGEALPEGVYFYAATVYTRRLVGIVPERSADKSTWSVARQAPQTDWQTSPTKPRPHRVYF